MWLLIIGIIILLLASVWHSYSTVGMKVSPIVAPAIFSSRRTLNSMLIHVGWFILFLIGITLLFIDNWIAGIVAIPIYWFLLPLVINPFLVRWLVGPWDKIPLKYRNRLREMGYNEKNYLTGNWWRKDFGKREFERLMKERK